MLPAHRIAGTRVSALSPIQDLPSQDLQHRLGALDAQLAPKRLCLRLQGSKCFWAQRQPSGRGTKPHRMRFVFIGKLVL